MVVVPAVLACLVALSVCFAFCIDERVSTLNSYIPYMSDRVLGVRGEFLSSCSWANHRYWGRERRRGAKHSARLPVLPAPHSLFPKKKHSFHASAGTSDEIVRSTALMQDSTRPPRVLRDFFPPVSPKFSSFEPPRFVLVNLSTQLCDFGLARSLGKAPSSATSPGGGSSGGAGGVAPDVEDGDSGGEVKLTEYVVTRWWRAPEVRRRKKEN